MKDLLDLLSTDPELNNSRTKVDGNDFCEMLRLFVNLAESMRLKLFEQIQDFSKYKRDYNLLKSKQNYTGKKKSLARQSSFLTNDSEYLKL